MTDENSPSNNGDGAPEDSATEQAGSDPVASREAELTEERNRYKDQMLRTAADFDNFRKRTRRELEDAERRGREDAIREILPIIDNLERAVNAADSASDAKAVADGVRMVLRLFEDVASSRLQLERVKTVGERFDPNVHEAVQQVETSEHPPGSIVAEVTAGYRIGDRLLRAALVVVARPNVNVTA